MFSCETIKICSFTTFQIIYYTTNKFNVKIFGQWKTLVIITFAVAQRAEKILCRSASVYHDVTLCVCPPHQSRRQCCLVADAVCQAGDVYGPRAEKQHVEHYHYTAWPDKALPTKPEILVQFLCQVLNKQASFSDAGPVVVHCRSLIY